MGVLLALNVVPLGNDMSKSLSSGDIWGFRFDYLLHTAMILGFAWIEVLKRVLGLTGIGVLRFSVLVTCSAVGLELLQCLIPWRSFNPVDLVYNLGGGWCGDCYLCFVSQQRSNADNWIAGHEELTHFEGPHSS